MGLISLREIRIGQFLLDKAGEGDIRAIRGKKPLIGLDGRIDDANMGWKGKGLWSTYSGRVPFHMEGGKGQTSKVVKFQLRPDPLAR